MASRSRSRSRRSRRLFRWAFRLLLLLAVADLAYLALLWPDWEALRNGPLPRSSFMLQYEQERRAHVWPRMRWQPARLSVIPPYMARAVILAEDSRFYTHAGFDLVALKEAWDYNLAERRLALGASTISQQTAKNLFLSPARTPWRKWHEAVLTVGLERNLNKRRILEIYLNVVELGRGIYGVDAAARHYWGVPASALSVEQAAELAATLPSPVLHNPRTRTRAFDQRKRKILGWLVREYPIEPAPFWERAWDARAPAGGDKDGAGLTARRPLAL